MAFGWLCGFFVRLSSCCVAVFHLDVFSVSVGVRFPLRKFLAVDVLNLASPEFWQIQALTLEAESLD